LTSGAFSATAVPNPYCFLLRGSGHFLSTSSPRLFCHPLVPFFFFSLPPPSGFPFYSSPRVTPFLFFPTGHCRPPISKGGFDSPPSPGSRLLRGFPAFFWFHCGRPSLMFSPHSHGVDSLFFFCPHLPQLPFPPFQGMFLARQLFSSLHFPSVLSRSFFLQCTQQASFLFPLPPLLQFTAVHGPLFPLFPPICLQILTQFSFVAKPPGPFPNFSFLNIQRSFPFLLLQSIPPVPS